MSSMRALTPLLLLTACYVEVHTDKDSGDTGGNLDENTRPTCQIISPAEGQVISANQFVTLQASVADDESDADSLEITWESNQAGDLGLSTAEPTGDASLTTDLLGPGLHLITLHVVDPGGLECVDQVTVDAQSAPVVTIEAPATGAVLDQGSITLAGTVSDAEQAPNLLAVTWTDDVAAAVIDSTPADALGAAAFTTDTLALGLHTVTLTAVDASGLVGSAEVTFTVNGVPTQPVVSILPVDPDTNADLVVSLDVPSTDPDGSPVTYVYEWLRDGVADAAFTTDTLPASATTRGEVWTVNVTPTDGVTSGLFATASATIANSPPAITLDVTPLDIYTNTVVHAEASAVDGDGDSFTLAYRWLVNGIQLAEAGPDLDGAVWFDKDDLIELTVTADDGLTVAAAVWNGTVANSPPVAGLVAITPGSPVDGDDLVCAIAIPATDPDGDLVSYDFDWDVNGVAFPDSSTFTTNLANDSIDNFSTGIGEFWTCTVTPNDGTEDGVIRQDTVFIGP
jgi:hypothetical protein